MGPVRILRYDRGELASSLDALAAEEPLEIRLSYCRRDGVRAVRPVSVTMRTPGDDAELAAGFLLTEGVVASAGEIETVTSVAGPGSAVEVRLGDGAVPNVRPLERNFYVSSSCGVCGKASIDALASARAPALDPDSPVLSLALLVTLPDRLRACQRTFDATGGLHAAGLFSAAGDLVCAREDVGRHNAVDKVVGAQLLKGASSDGLVLVLSGRAGFELVQKALMAGLAAIVSVGAPSTLAVETARRYGATLVGFARNGRANIYSGAQRLQEAGAVSEARGA